VEHGQRPVKSPRTPHPEEPTMLLASLAALAVLLIAESVQHHRAMAP
jgi:hypothetical protein